MYPEDVLELVLVLTKRGAKYKDYRLQGQGRHPIRGRNEHRPFPEGYDGFVDQTLELRGVEGRLLSAVRIRMRLNDLRCAIVDSLIIYVHFKNSMTSILISVS